MTDQRAHDEQVYGHSISRTAIALRDGHLFDIFDPPTWKWDLEQVATALGNLCRFNGQVDFYSVAEHCVRVSRWIEQQCPGDTLAALVGLHHDDEEAIIGDIVSPHKRTMAISTYAVEQISNDLRYHAWACLLPPVEIDARIIQIVHEADAAVYRIEATERPKVGEGWTPWGARRRWLSRHRSLVDRIHHQAAAQAYQERIIAEHQRKGEQP